MTAPITFDWSDLWIWACGLTMGVLITLAVITAAVVTSGRRVKRGNGDR